MNEKAQVLIPIAIALVICIWIIVKLIKDEIN
jgi:F0F1-type ATP synthase membrane subunit b/b'